MEWKTIGERGMMITFDDRVAVYAIRGENRIFLCDTHLGPDSMKSVKLRIAAEWGDKEIVVFNTHSDWDHIWGNCVFEKGLIIAHATCRSRMAERGEWELAQMAGYRRGVVRIILPNLTFDRQLTFAAEGVSFIHAPGHTPDSAVCFDHRDSVLFVGDVVEDPIPYLDDYDLAKYLGTLDFVKNFSARVKIAAHSGIIDNSLIDRNMAYVRDILAGHPVAACRYQGAREVHQFNLKNRILLKYEQILREKTGLEFNYSRWMEWVAGLTAVDGVDLEVALMEIVAKERMT